jgi:hypothetical protein
MYINPIEILGLSNISDAGSLNDEIIKKAKRKLFAEIDLSDDGVFDYYGMQLTKGDCERAIDGLNINGYKEFYLYLVTNRSMNEFLAVGTGNFFGNFKQENIIQVPEFIKFVSPFFSEKFDKALLTAFENNNPEQTRLILNTSILIVQEDLNSAFKSVSSIIQNRIAEIEIIIKDIKNEDGNYDEENIDDISKLVKDYFPANTLNCLPQYFQSQILIIANSINRLSHSIWDAFDTTQVPNDLSEYLLTLHIEGLNKPVFERNFKIINKKHTQRLEQEEHAPLLRKWAGVLLKVRDATNKIEGKLISSAEVFQEIRGLFDLDELNSLPSFANEIRRQIGYAIRALSIAMWNKQSDITSALSAISLALQITTDAETIGKFKQDQFDLLDFEKKYRGVLICHFCGKNTPDQGSKIIKTIYKETDRSFIPRSVKFSYVEVEIPRCKSCQSIHVKGREQFLFFLLGGILLGAIIGQLINEHFIIFGLIGGLVGWFVGNLMERRLSSKKGVKDDSNSTLRNHPLLSQRIKGGWTFSKPSA